MTLTDGALHYVECRAALNLTYITDGAVYHVRYTAATNPAWFVARPVRLERTTCGFEVRRSIQLSYGCALCNELILQSAGQELQPRRERHFG